jgi:hypothetical protein
MQSAGDLEMVTGRLMGLLMGSFRNLSKNHLKSGATGGQVDTVARTVSSPGRFNSDGQEGFERDPIPSALRL